MKARFLLVGTLLTTVLQTVASPPRNSTRFNRPPIPAPKLFGEGVISTVDDEFGGTLSPDGKTFFFCKKGPATGRSNVLVICFAEKNNGKWGNVQIAPFSGTYRDFNPQFSPDGMRLYFMSNRPITGTQPKPDSDIWFAERTNSGWSKPKNLGDKINSPFLELACSFTNSGDMYFSSARNGKALDIYVSKFLNGEFQEPQPLDSIINSGGLELDACIAPDGSYLLFTSNGRPDMLTPKNGVVYPRSDIYVSYHENDKWTVPLRLPEPINSTAEDSNPAISRDGTTLFFTSKRNFVKDPLKHRLNYDQFEKELSGPFNGFGNIFSISTDVLSKK